MRRRVGRGSVGSVVVVGGVEMLKGLGVSCVVRVVGVTGVVRCWVSEVGFMFSVVGVGRYMAVGCKRCMI